MAKSSSSLRKSLTLSFLRAFIWLSLLKICYTTGSASYYDFFLDSVPLAPAKTGFKIAANTGIQQFGYSVKTAGDINNDGYDDIIIGAYQGNNNKGAAYVIYGGNKSSMSNIDLSLTTLDPATTGFMITGSYGSFLGYSVGTAGDINKDGYDDIIIGATDEHKVYVIYGGEKSSMSNIDLGSTTLDPLTTGFHIKGNGSNSWVGWSVGAAGDFNNDGYADIIFNYNAQKASLIYGGEKSSMSNIDLSMTTLDPATTGFTIIGNVPTDYLGNSLSAAGDINKDGYDDIIIGAPGKFSNRGAAYVIYGREKSSISNIDLSITTLDPATTGFMITGNAASDSLGRSVSTAGDINNDGYDDMIIGASGKFSNKGAAYIVYGGEKSSMKDLDLSFTTLDPAMTGFLIRGNAANDYFGRSVSAAGDLNKDGYNDVIVGAPGLVSGGTAFVIYGGEKSSMSNIDLASTILDPVTKGFKITGEGGSFGLSVSTAGDINKDGYRDIIIGAPSWESSRGAVYVIHTACSQCYNCPADCNQCDSPSSCLECTIPSLRYDSQCITSCPTATFNSTNICKSCPPFCSSCTSRTSCQACDPGFTLSNSLCVVPTLETKAKAVQAVTSGAKAVGSVVCVGSVTFPLTALVSKIVQSTRYLNLSVTEELAEIYQTWDTHMISWQVPSSFSRSDHFKKSSSLFARYDLGSPFLVNFWPILMTIGVSWVAFIVFLVLKKVFEKAEYRKDWIYFLLQKLVIGSFNFALVQTYGCLDDILFYLVIDAKTNPFSNFFSWASLICAFGFMVIGFLFVFFNFWTVIKYQSLKSQALAKKNFKDLKTFNEESKYWGLFYSDFNDDNFWGQSFLPLIIIRSSLSSLIIAALYDVLLFQTMSLLVLDGAVLLFLFSKNPFKKLRGKLAQYYFEIITLLVHICTFTLSLETSSERALRAILSTAIIYLNTALVTGGTGFMFIEIYETINQMAKPGKYGHIAIQTSKIENHTSSPDLVVSQIQHRESNKALGEFQRLGSNMFVVDNSVVTEMNTSDLIMRRRDQGSSPIISVIQNDMIEDT